MVALARLLSEGGAAFELMLGQVFLGRKCRRARRMAAAALTGPWRGADLIHMSLGLAADRGARGGGRPRAVGAGCVVVASARGAVWCTRRDGGVIRGTGMLVVGRGNCLAWGPGFFWGVSAVGWVSGRRSALRVRAVEDAGVE